MTKQHINLSKLQLFYPNSFEITSNSMENFTMFTTPFNGVRTDFRNWFLSGLFWDLNDNLLDNVTGTSQLLNGQIVIQDTVLASINDYVFIGPSAGLIYNQLTSNVYNNFDLKNSLLSSYPTQAIAIDLLFRTYGLYY